MPRRRPAPACDACRGVREAHQVLDARILAVKTRLLNHLEAMERASPARGTHRVPR